MARTACATARSSMTAAMRSRKSGCCPLQQQFADRDIDRDRRPLRQRVRMRDRGRKARIGDQPVEIVVAEETDGRAAHDARVADPLPARLAIGSLARLLPGQAPVEVHQGPSRRRANVFRVGMQPIHEAAGDVVAVHACRSRRCSRRCRSPSACRPSLHRARGAASRHRRSRAIARSACGPHRAKGIRASRRARPRTRDRAWHPANRSCETICWLSMALPI